jgi:hypothetical protein
MAPKLEDRKAKFRELAAFIESHADEFGERLRATPCAPDATLQRKLLSIFRRSVVRERKYYWMLRDHRDQHFSDPAWVRETFLLQSAWDLIRRRSENVASENAGLCLGSSDTTPFADAGLCLDARSPQGSSASLRLEGQELTSSPTAGLCLSPTSPQGSFSSLRLGEHEGTPSPTAGLRLDTPSRYSPGFWGKEGGRRAAGRKAKGSPGSDARGNGAFKELNIRNLEVCRRLCLSLAPADLKERLSTSRWSPKERLS